MRISFFVLKNMENSENNVYNLSFSTFFRKLLFFYNIVCIYFCNEKKYAYVYFFVLLSFRIF